MYNPVANARVITGSIGAGVVDVPIVFSPDFHSAVGIAIFVAGTVVLAFLLAAVSLAVRIYWLRMTRPRAAVTELVWLQTFDTTGWQPARARGRAARAASLRLRPRTTPEHQPEFATRERSVR